MSTHWGLYCEDCKASSPHWFNHGEKWVREIVSLWPSIETLIDHDLNWVAFKFEWFTWEDPSPSEWLTKHGRHALALENEYGDRKPLAP